MKEVTFYADNYEELQSIYLARRMYLHPDEEKKLSGAEINELYKRFSNGFNHMKHEPSMKNVLT